MTDVELVARCRQGDRDAQRELYDRTSQRIYRLLVRMTGSEETAFDLAQDTYLRAFTRIRQFDGRSSPATWLYRIAVTEALQFLRREKRFRAEFHESTCEAAVEAATERSAARLDVQDALAALDPADRTMLLLRHEEGLDYRAISEVAGCAEGTVASRLHRARKRLKEILGKSYAHAEESEGVDHLKDRAPGPADQPSAAREAGQRKSYRK